jgi:hypothetical protein
MSQETEIDWGNVAQWAGAISTFLAVLTALFKDEYLRWKRRPLLNVAITLAPPDCEKTKLTYSQMLIFSPPASGIVAQGAQGLSTTPPSISADCYYLRLSVENTGKTTAERVQVYAASLLKKQADATFRKVDGFLPMSLKWAHSHEIYADAIHPKMCKHCDLGHILEPAYRKNFPGEDNLSLPQPDKTILSLDLEVQPNTFGHLIHPGVYKLELRVAGANCKPVSNVLNINLTGDWFSDEQKMFSDGVGISVLD